MKSVIEKIGKTHYLFTHQTEESVAQKIFNEEFHTSPGNGISGTMSWLGSEGVINQIQRQLQGDAHRGYKGMFLVAIPKELLDTGSRNKADALEEYLMDHETYGKYGNGDIYIPKEYNLGYLQGSVLHVNPAFVEAVENNSENITTNQELESIVKEVKEISHELDQLLVKKQQLLDEVKTQWHKGKRGR